MSFIPNTTPTPNWLYNGEMKKMSDVELRVVLLVTRHTLGWLENPETGMRKQEDWISHTMLIEKTGRSSKSVSNAVANCVNHGWIETRDSEGNLLITSNDRRRRRVFYRLGNIFTDKLKSTVKSTVDENLPQNTTKSTILDDTNLHAKVRNTKETLQKKLILNLAEQAPREWILEEKLLEMEKTENSYLDIIATFIREKPVSVENGKQLSAIISRYCRVAKKLSGAYSNKQIFDVGRKIKADNEDKKRKGQEQIDYSLETYYKYLTK